MFSRLLSLPKKHHFFLFGPRNTGKSTLLETAFSQQNCLWLDLLDQDLEERLKRRPNDLYDMVKAMSPKQTHVIIDEVQKVPALLNVVQRLMKDKQKIFILTGSSARKLKRESANLLAGRAFIYNLYPLSYLELAEKFDLDRALQFGTLPEIFDCENDEECRDFLMAYAHSYLREEIIVEQFIRNLSPFRRFLEVAAQSNGKIINFAKLARDVSIDAKTAKSYFSILEDTLIGYLLEPYHGSLRKRVHQKPKFYFFDTGIVRGMARHLTIPLVPSTNAYGNAFEHFIINQCISLNEYYKKDYKFSYLRTTTDQEIDLIIERPGREVILIKIKSAREVNEKMFVNLQRLASEFKHPEKLGLSNDKYAKQYGDLLVMHWKDGLKKIFDIED